MNQPIRSWIIEAAEIQVEVSVEYEVATVKDLASQIQALWESIDSPPDVFAFLELHKDADIDTKLAVVLVDQAYRSKSSRPLRVEDYLSQLPDLAGDCHCKLQLAIGEFQARRSGDTFPDIDEFTSRFSDLGDTLQSALAELVSHVEHASSECDVAMTESFAATTNGIQQMGRYRLVRVLGEGAYGRVYLGFDDELQRAVAIKVPTAEQFRNPGDIETYLCEARTVAGLDHPNIVPVYDTGRTEDGSIYVVSKYIKGLTLREKIQQDRPGFSAGAKLLATVARALHHAHERRLIHRDVKPGNILLEDRTGTPYVADFGLAVREEDYLKQCEIAGTPAYMSPEQVRGEGHRLDGRSDIFSLGVVFYELLTGKRPFRGSTANELYHQILTADVRSPRELDDSIPAELARICLKTLSKRASDRYSTALELADDLINWNQTPAHQQEVPIVPKGLRSFDAEDSEFFLSLLPGPRNRDGLPESIQFWKTRIEQTDSDQTFSVGLIYGPSGCGKSSLVKAGLLPRLSDNVLAIYIEATPDETETRILRALRRQVKLPDDISLSNAFAALRRGAGPAGKKLIIVLDQFEQWLHAHRSEQGTELVAALRQCDGGSLQVVVMVRDDFSMAVSRFMRELEARIVEGHNFATVDLFDEQHARMILIKFGQAYGKLPSQIGQLTDEEREFVTSIASGLAVDGKVVSVRLALFAEIIKGKPWIPATWERIGGTAGIGVNFLEETFSSRDANPECRLHQQAARQVLKALLPAVGTDIKGHMRSHAELLNACGYHNRLGEFNDLLRILDGELRLITPTDPLGFQSNSDCEPTSKFYQLTHDYLVTSLRAWLTRKQKETLRGQAELKLEERAVLWNDKRENRRLPSLWEWGCIQLLTDKTTWNESQRQMMARAGRSHGVRWGMTLFVTLLIGVTIQQVIAVTRHRSLLRQIATTVSSLNTSRGVVLPPLTDLDNFPRDVLLAELREQFEAADKARKLPLAYALARFGDVRVEFLVAQIESASPEEVENLVSALGRVRSDSVIALESAARVADGEKKWRHKVRLAMIAMQLEDLKLVKEMCDLRPDLTQRTWFIEQGSLWYRDLSKLAELVADIDDGPFRSGIALVAGSADKAQVAVSDKQTWEPILSNWYRNEPDSLTHSAAVWVLRKWELDVPEIEGSSSPAEGTNWHVNSMGMTMLQIPAGSFVRRVVGEEDESIEQHVTLTRSFLLADCEVTREQFWQFIGDASHPADEKPTDRNILSHAFNPTGQHPIVYVNWYDAVLFCNWLSRRERLSPCYERTGELEVIDGRDYSEWRLIPEANGYRLPTDAEWEFACRAGTVTPYCHGDELSLLNRYAVCQTNQLGIPGRKLPNSWGLFDVHGNAFEWCYDWLAPLGSEIALGDPTGPVDGTIRVLHGGSFLADLQFLRSSYRSDNGFPSLRNFSVGFRVARTYP